MGCRHRPGLHPPSAGCRLWRALSPADVDADRPAAGRCRCSASAGDMAGATARVRPSHGVCRATVSLVFDACPRCWWAVRAAALQDAVVRWPLYGTITHPKQLAVWRRSPQAPSNTQDHTFMHRKKKSPPNLRELFDQNVCVRHRLLSAVGTSSSCGTHLTSFARPPAWWHHAAGAFPSAGDRIAIPITPVRYAVRFFAALAKSRAPTPCAPGRRRPLKTGPLLRQSRSLFGTLSTRCRGPVEPTATCCSGYRRNDRLPETKGPPPGATELVDGPV